MSAPTPDPGRMALEAEDARGRRCTIPAPLPLGLSGEELIAAQDCTAPAAMVVRERSWLSAERRVWTPCREHLGVVADRHGVIVEEIEVLRAAVVSATYRLVAARRGEFGRRASLAAHGIDAQGDPLALYAEFVEMLERLRDTDIGAMKAPDDPAATVPGERTSDR